MDLSLSEEQELLRNSARDFLASECPEEHVRAMEEDERVYSPELWKKIKYFRFTFSPLRTTAPLALCGQPLR